MSGETPLTGSGKAVCVTGASGFAGAHIVKELLLRGYTVKATVRDANNEEKYGWIKKLQDGTPGKLELYSADLLEPGSFDKAVEGAELVCHVAAVVAFNPKDPKDVVDPALEGTRNVFASILKAKTAKRVVITSSVATIRDDFQPNGRTYTEADWHQECNLKSPYAMGKTLAEKYAWKEYEELKNGKKEGEGWGGFELVSILPGLIIGGVLDKAQATTSLKLFIQMLDGSMPLAPDFHFNIVHVRDVTLAHVLALEKPEAKGRYIVVDDGSTSMLDISRIIKSAYPGAKVPTLPMPTLLLYAFSLVNPILSLEQARRRAGMVCYYSNKKAKEELGIEFIPPTKAILDTVKTLTDFGLVTVAGVSPAPNESGET